MVNTVQRIVVKFKSTGEGPSRTLRELCDQVVEITGCTLMRPPSATGRAVFLVPASSDLYRLMEDIRKLPTVEYAEPDAVDRALK